MPCWYYDKKDLQNTPSFRDGISPEMEAKYRKDGARFIIDAGTKMGLRFDTNATGVVYFHRFYMFHSFLEFPGSVMAACCLFLAGKVEETPKKCKDLIKITKSMLTEAQFAAFKDDPKEELMTMERILLQTIKFDLMVEHPYAYLLRFAKVFKGDKAKVQKLVQMSWTFTNDSLCTTLCLQWEPEVTAVALMYLASRLSKFEINDWQNKPLGYKGKWYEFFVEDITLDLLEDICHQVLDFYSESSRNKTTSPTNLHSQFNDIHPSKAISTVTNVKKPTLTSAGAEVDLKNIMVNMPQVNSAKLQTNPVTANHCPTWQSSNLSMTSTHSQHELFSQTNPYVATGMYSSSFMNQEGLQSIQTLVDNQESTAQYAKIVGYPQSFQQQTGQTFPSVTMQYAYQQPLQTILSSGAPKLVQVPGFAHSVGNSDGSFVYQNSAIQGNHPKTHPIYQEASPGSSFNQSSVQQWR